MAFEIGQRVTSTFTGPGTVTGELSKDSDTGDGGKVVITSFQVIKFDNASIGERRWAISKLYPLDEEKAKTKKVVLAKSKAQLDYDAAILEGLTHFRTVEGFTKDNPRLDVAEYQWLKTQIVTRGYVINIYATEKNAGKISRELGEVLGIPADEARKYLDVRPRKGGSKWNVNFVNFAALTTAVRDQLEVNFSHYKGGDYEDIRHVRCGVRKLVQQLLKDGLLAQIPEGGGDGS